MWSSRDRNHFNQLVGNVFQSTVVTLAVCNWVERVRYKISNNPLVVSALVLLEGLCQWCCTRGGKLYINLTAE